MTTVFKNEVEACIGDVFVMELQIKRSNGQWTLAQVHQGKKAVDRTWECGLLSSVSKRFHTNKYISDLMLVFRGRTAWGVPSHRLASPTYIPPK